MYAGLFNALMVHEYHNCQIDITVMTHVIIIMTHVIIKKCTDLIGAMLFNIKEVLKMLWQTHVVIGAAAGIMAGPIAGKETIVAASISGLAALLPDIDTPCSKLGRRRPVTSGVVSLFFGHRGALHSVVGCIAVLAVFSTILPKYMLRYIGLGYMSHIFADMLNPAGVPFLWPIKKRLRVPIIRTGGVLEKYVLMPVLLLFLGEHLFFLLK